MTLDEANEIVALWGQHLEFRGDVLQRLFIASIPKVLLPARPEAIEKALNTAVKHYQDAGDHEAAQTLIDTFGHLMLYGDDDAALEEAAVKFQNLQIRRNIIAELEALRR